jgi:hypothetical protein
MLDGFFGFNCLSIILVRKGGDLMPNPQKA